MRQALARFAAMNAPTAKVWSVQVKALFKKGEQINRVCIPMILAQFRRAKKGGSTQSRPNLTNHHYKERR
jgi:hypothetical protein